MPFFQVRKVMLSTVKWLHLDWLQNPQLRYRPSCETGIMREA